MRLAYKSSIHTLNIANKWVGHSWHVLDFIAVKKIISKTYDRPSYYIKRMTK